MRAIVINPWLRTVTEIEDLAGENYRDLYRVLTHEGQPKVDDFNSVRVSSFDVMWVDGEGMLKSDIPVFNFNQYPGTLAGIGVITGIDESGETVPTKMPLLAAQRAVEWTTLTTTGQLTPTTTPAPGVIRVGDPILKESN